MVILSVIMEAVKTAENGGKGLYCLTIYTALCIVKTIEFESEIECFATIEFDHRIFQKPDVLETLAKTSL